MTTTGEAGITTRRGWLHGILDRLLNDNATALRELHHRATPSLILGISVFCALQGAAFLLASRSQGSGFEQMLTMYGAIADLGIISWALWSIACLVMAACVGIERAYSPFDWERKQDSLDQHVTTGSSPLRVLEGKLTIAVAQAGIMLMVSTPFALALHTILDVPVLHLLASMAGALCFGLACFGVSIWLNSYVEDVGAAFATALIALVLVAFAMKSLRDPGHLAALLPLYPVLVRLHSAYDPATVAMQLFGHPTPGWLIFALAYVGVGLLGLAAGALGPPAIEGRLSRTFGTLPTDRPGRRRRRSPGADVARRMADLRFLYQNRADWMQRHEALLRQLHSLVGLTLFLMLGLGMSWHLLADPLRSAGLIEQLLVIITVPIVWAVVSATVSTCELRENEERPFLRVTLVTSLALLLLPLLFVISGYPYGAPVDESYLRIAGLTVLMQTHGLLLIALGFLIGISSPARSHTVLLQMGAGVLLYAAVPFVALEGMRVDLLDARGFLALEASLPYVFSELLDQGVITLTLAEGGDLVAMDFHFDPLRAAVIACALTLVVAGLTAWRLLSLGALRSRARPPVAGGSAAGSAGAALLATCLLAGAASAQGSPATPGLEDDPGGPRIEVCSGWEGETTGPISPICVTVTAGDRPCSGTLAVVESASRRPLWSGSVDLEPGAVRRLRLAAGITLGGGVSAILNVDGSRGKALTARGYAVSGVGGWWRPGLLFVDRDSLAPLEVMNTRPSSGIFCCKPEHFPETVSALNGIGCIVLGRVSVVDLDPAQLQMLGRYVAGGGRIAVTAGGGGSGIVRSFDRELAAWLDAAVPHAIARRLSLCELAGEEALSGEELELADLEPALALAGQVEMASDGVPLVASRNLGRGEISLLAMDLWAPPLAGTRLATFLAAHLTEGVATSPAFGATQGRRHALGEMGSHGSILWISWALVSLAMTLLPYLVARRRRRALALWAGVPLGVLVALVLVVATAKLLDRISTRVTLDSIAWFSRGVDQGVTDYHLSLVSQGRDEASVTLPGVCPDAIAIPAEDRDSRYSWGGIEDYQSLRGVPAADGSCTEFPGFRITRWDANLLVASRLDPPAPPAHARLVIGGSGEVRLLIDGLEERLECVFLQGFPYLTEIGTQLRPDEGEILLTRVPGMEVVRLQQGTQRTGSGLRRLDDQITLQFAHVYSQRGNLHEPRLYARVPGAGRRLVGAADLVELPGLHHVSLPVEVDLEPGAEVDVADASVPPRSCLTVAPPAGAPATVGSYQIFSAVLPRMACELEPVRITMPEPSDRRNSRRGARPDEDDRDVAWVEVWDYQSGRWAAVEEGELGAVLEPVDNRRLERLVYTGESARRLVEPRTGRMWIRLASRDALHARRWGGTVENRSLLREIVVRARPR